MLQAFLDGRLFGNQRGESTPLVIALHGWQRSSSDFDAVLGTSGSRDEDPFDGEPIPSIAVDLPGFGISPSPPAPWGTFDYATELISLLESFERPVVLVGHSFGGRVAIQLAATAPELVRGLVLTGVPIRESRRGGARPDWRFRLLRRGNKLGLVSETRIESARQRFGSSDYRNAVGVMRSVLVNSLADDYIPLLSTISAPTELVWGELDTAAPVSGAMNAVAVMHEAHLRVLPGVGHMVPLEAPAALRESLRRWSN